MPLRSRVQPAVAGCRAAALRVAALVLLAAAAAAASPEALAQQPAPRPKPATAGDRSTRRLFQRFVEDAAISSGGWVEGQYQYDMHVAETLDTQLNVFADFHPELPEDYRATQYVFLANIHPQLQLEVLSQVQRPKLVQMR